MHRSVQQRPSDGERRPSQWTSMQLRDGRELAGRVPRHLANLGERD
jgi:hypothetical protein